MIRFGQSTRTVLMLLAVRLTDRRLGYSLLHLHTMWQQTCILYANSYFIQFQLAVTYQGILNLVSGDSF